MEESTFSFLEEEFPDIYNVCIEMENNIRYENYESSLISARKAAEMAVIQIYKFRELDLDKDDKQYKRLTTLRRKKLIENKIFYDYQTIRDYGNKAAHSSAKFTQEEIFHVHHALYNVLKVFYIDYSEKNRKVNPYTTVKLFNTETAAEQLLNYLKNNKTLNKKFKDIIDVPDNYKSSDEDVVESTTIESHPKDSVQEKYIEDQNISIEDELTKFKGSYLLGQLVKLKSSSQEAVEGLNNLSNFKNYLHVDRNIQDELLEKLQSVYNDDRCHLILLCGSVGDGKSHMLAYLNENYPDLMGHFDCLNDATESNDPNKTSLETLAVKLSDFDDEHIDSSSKKLIVSINLGILNNFIESNISHNYTKLVSILNDLNIFDADDFSDNYEKDPVSIISFSDYNLFEFDENTHKFKSDYMSDLFSKITDENENNPFYLAYMADYENNLNSPILYNYMLFSDKSIQDIIIQYLIKVIVKYKKIFSTRDLFNFIYEILVPAEIKNYALDVPLIDYIDDLLPNLLFQSQDRCDILNILYKEGPVHQRRSIVDEILIELNTSPSIKDVLSKYMCNDNLSFILNDLNYSMNDIDSRDEKELITSSIIRFLRMFGNEDIKKAFMSESYEKYVNYLYYYNKNDKKNLKDLINDIRQAIFNWKGSVNKDNLVILNLNKFKIAKDIDIKFSSICNIPDNVSNPNRFKTFIQIKFKANKEDEIMLNLDYSSYEAIEKLNKGYKTNKNEQRELLLFNDFINQLINSVQSNEYTIYNILEDKTFELELNEFDQYVFKRV